MQITENMITFLDGFFIEAGAYDFEYESTSLYFELIHNWTVKIDIFTQMTKYKDCFV